MDKVIVEFVADTSQLQPAVEILEQQGKIDQGNAVIFGKTNQVIKDRSNLVLDSKKSTDSLSVSVSAQQVLYNKLVASVKNLSGASKDAVEQFLKFTPDVLAEKFKELNVNVDDYIKDLEAASEPALDLSTIHGTLTAQLNQTKDALAALGPRTTENAELFDELAKKGGELSESLRETRTLVRTLGSESPTLNAFSESVSGLAGAFQAGVGAAALFGSENKDLQEVLVKVTSVTAIAQGIQQTSNLVKRNGGLATLQLAIATDLESAAKSKNTVISIAATVAQQAFNLALKANPIGIFITLLGAAAAALAIFAENSKAAKAETDKLNNSLSQTALLEEHLKNIDVGNTEIIAGLQARNTRESQITKAQADNIRNTIKERDEQIARNQAALDAARKKREDDATRTRFGKLKEASKEEIDLNTKTKELRSKNDDDYTKLRITNIAQVKQATDEQLADEKSKSDKRLADATKNSKDFFAAQRLVINAQTQIDLKNAGNDEEKKNAIIAKRDQDLREVNIAQDQVAANRKVAAQETALINIQNKTRQVNERITKEELEQQKKVNDAATQAAITDASLRGLGQAEVDKIKAEGRQKNQDLDIAFAQKEFEFRNQAEQNLIKKELTNQENTDAQELELAKQLLLKEEELAIASARRKGENTIAIEIETNFKILQLQNQFDQAKIKAELLNVGISADKELDLNKALVIKQFDLAIAAAKKQGESTVELEAQKNDKLLQLDIEFNNKLAQQQKDRINVNTANELDSIEKTLAAQQEIQNSPTPKRTATLLGVDPKTVQEQQELVDKTVTIAKQGLAVDFENNQKNFEEKKKLAGDSLTEQSKAQQEFNDTYQALLEKSVKIDNDATTRKQKIAKDHADFQKAMNKAIVNAAIQGVADGLNILASLYQQQDQAAQDRLNRQKQRIQDELDAGAITAKAAAERFKEIDAQQKALQREAAKRNKEIAIFQAIIGTAQAVIAALDAPPPLNFIGAAIAGALGAAQIAVIASTPLPQFEKGKKGLYEGPGLVAEKGRAEIIEQNGKMFVVEKPSVVWLGSRDKVYTPDETMNIMNTTTMNTSPTTVNTTSKVINPTFDYKKLGKAVAESFPGFNLNIDGYKEFIKEKNSFTTKLNSRRKWL